MKKSIVYAMVLLGCAACKPKQTSTTPPKLSKDNVKEVVAAMTLEEKAQIVVGAGMAGFTGAPVVGSTHNLVPGAAGTTQPIERLGIPAIVLADGPAGLRISPRRKDDDKTYFCTGFPVGTLLACTWNSELVEQVGAAMGNEVKEYGVDVLLAPGMNIHRNPLCGRNFEYYSEDPYLTGKTAAAMTKGVQSNGVGVSVKHFAVNNQETNRNNVDAIVSPRALREIYLRGFEIAVKDADPWTIMSSYNYINGTYASESRDLLRDITRDEWGFRGLVMTDWGGGKNAAAQIHAGNDLLMPGRSVQYENIVAAVKDGSLAVEDLDWCVENVLNLIVRTPRFAGYEYSDKPDLTAHAQVTRQSAAEGMVLLKNDNAALPFAETVKNVALFGITSYDFIAGGTGSGDVNKAYVIDLRQGLTNAGYVLDQNVDKYYEKYIAAEKAKIEAKIDKKNPWAMFLTRERVKDVAPAAAILNKAAAQSDIAVITIGRNSGEGADRKVENDFCLTDAEKELITKVTEAFNAAGKRAVVVLNVGGVVETASWKAVPDAILLAWQAGQEGGNTVADVLAGVVNPSGKLSMTFPVNYMDNISSKNFPYDFTINQKDLWQLFIGNASDGKEPKANVDYTVYAEDVYVGYRYFDTFGVEVSYPFGYGLSYTSFDYSDAAVKSRGGKYTATVTVTNSGNKAGKEVVELYVASPACSAGRPAQELVAYAKTSLLNPGESETLTLVFDRSQLGWYDEARTAWILEKGDYELRFGASSRDIRCKVPFRVRRGKTLEKTHASLLPQREIATVKPE